MANEDKSKQVRSGLTIFKVISYISFGLVSFIFAVDQIAIFKQGSDSQSKIGFANRLFNLKTVKDSSNLVGTQKISTPSAKLGRESALFQDEQIPNGNPSEQSRNENSSQAMGSASSIQNNSKETSENKSKETDSGNKPLSQIEISSVGTLLTAVNDFIVEKSSIDKVIENLTSIGLAPEVSTDRNELTGEMTIIRTENALPGTRYLHAQYFKNEFGVNQLQHLSFEVRAGSDTSDLVKQMIQREFKQEAAISFLPNQKFQEWHIAGGYTVWTKKLTKDDLGNDIFNAHDPIADENTIRIGIELNPHPQTVKSDNVERENHL